MTSGLKMAGIATTAALRAVAAGCRDNPRSTREVVAGDLFSLNYAVDIFADANTVVYNLAMGFYTATRIYLSAYQRGDNFSWSRVGRPPRVSANHAPGAGQVPNAT